MERLEEVQEADDQEESKGQRWPDIPAEAWISAVFGIISDLLIELVKALF